MNRLTKLCLGIASMIQLVYPQAIPFSSGLQDDALFKSDARRAATLMKAMQASVSEPNIDVTYYKLDLTLTGSSKYLRGVVTIKAKSTVANLKSVTLDLDSAMTVDSVKSGPTALSFVQETSTVTVTLNRTYVMGELVVLDIAYRGFPAGGSWPGSPSLTFDDHAGSPWIVTISAPYGARNWWPCKDHPSDKADSVDIWATVDSTLKVGSNGKLLAVINNRNGTSTYRWAERYPICTYLVSIALTNYTEFSNWFRYAPNDSMQVLNYVLPEHLVSAQAVLPLTVNMLAIYSERFGLYPFIKEKYGHAEAAWMGGMENQTMTTIGNWTEGLVAHELAHSWFGNMITCASWSHVWLNEGFAEYAVALYYEATRGRSSYFNFMSSEFAKAKSAAGPLIVRDTLDVAGLFSYGVYYKGAAVLHMLRHVLGDSIFPRAIKAYATDPRFRFGVATSEDFQQVCESVSGTSLKYFFDEWMYGERYPDYVYVWKSQPAAGGSDVAIRVMQSTGTPNPAYFIMPIDFAFSAPGWDTTVTVKNTLPDQTFTVRVSHKPEAVQLDPAEWILRTATGYQNIYLAMNTAYTTFGAFPDSFTVRDTTFMMKNVGFGDDSIRASVVPGSVSPDSAVSISPTQFWIASGDSQRLTFRVRPKLLSLNKAFRVKVQFDAQNGMFENHSNSVRKEFGFMVRPATGIAEATTPKEAYLDQNFPNPFNPSTSISYQLPSSNHVSLIVYDLLGRALATLVDENKPPGVHNVHFDASRLASGVYFYRMQAGAYTSTRKLVLVK